ncbi:hypothetical protein M9Y10_015586 [Tritrichomonas musculus]|uniref:Uncharacterized protein n=1 Tax=Tritrichomonas musculus TaxID=1915356 RepID=A0ABR2L2P1_9EUKA
MISITDCQFDHNIVTLSSSENSLFGGSSIFFTAKKGNVKSCTFLYDEGPSSLKIYNKFNTNTKSLLSEGLLAVTDCKFEIGSNSKCSIFYEGGNGGAKFDLTN